MNKYDYSRKGKTIIDHSDGSTKVFDSINQAKKESRRLQAAGKTLQKIE